MREQWLAEKRADADALRDLPLTDIVPSRRDFTQFVATQKQGLAIVPRLQRRNPVSGASRPLLDVAALARAFDDSEAGAIAVRTAKLFEGSIVDLDAVRAAATAPLLRDDLCIGQQQIYASRLHGADAVVLPAGDLPADALRELAAIANSTHMAAVIEVTDDAQLAAALALPTACIGLACAGVDGRLDGERALALAKTVPSHRVVLLLGEIAAAADLEQFVGVVDAAVVGDVLLAAAEPRAALDALLARVG
jgi:indole-3-glycerol phosphate synthase